MMLSALVVLLLSQAYQDGYHQVPLAKLATTRWTHACVTGPVVYVRKQRDGDIHVTLSDGTAKVVLEIIPAIPLARPKKGQTIRACGITRIDPHHGWAELHPLLSYKIVSERK